MSARGICIKGVSSPPDRPGRALAASVALRGTQRSAGGLGGAGRPGGGAVCGSGNKIPRPERWLLSDGPLALPPDWVGEVNRPQKEGELAAVRQCVQRGQPFGEAGWVQRVAGLLGLESTLRPRGRPMKNPN